MSVRTFSLTTVLTYITGKMFCGPQEHLRLAQHLMPGVQYLDHRKPEVMREIRAELCFQFPDLAQFAGAEVTAETVTAVYDQALRVSGETLEVHSACLRLNA